MVVWVIALLACTLALVLWVRRMRAIRSVTNFSRGDGAERDLVGRLVRYGLPAESIFHDLFIEKTNGEYSQFDAVAITDVGIIIFEVKNYAGDIEGDGRSEVWHHKLAGGTKHHRFYNPVFQNEGHITTLRKAHPQLRSVPIFSVIVFYGNCHLRRLSHIPDSCHIIHHNRLTKTLDEILTHNPPTTYRNRDTIVNILRKGVANGADRRIVAHHRRTVQQRFGSRHRTSHTLWPRLLPLCGRRKG